MKLFNFLMIATAIVTSATGNEIPIKSGSTVRDGLILSFEQVNQEALAPQLLFKILNTNETPIYYEAIGYVEGFSIRMLDDQGNPIPKEAHWQKLTDPLNDILARDRGTIDSKQSLLYTLDFNKAYGDRWRKGKTLVVEWDPGANYSENRRHQFGRGLKAELDMALVRGEAVNLKQDVSQETVPQITPSPVEPKNTERAERKPDFSAEESKGSTDKGTLIGWVGGTLAILIALVMFLKKRNP